MSDPTRNRDHLPALVIALILAAGALIYEYALASEGTSSAPVAATSSGTYDALQDGRTGRLVEDVNAQNKAANPWVCQGVTYPTANAATPFYIPGTPYPTPTAGAAQTPTPLYDYTDCTVQYLDTGTTVKPIFVDNFSSVVALPAGSEQGRELYATQVLEYPAVNNMCTAGVAAVTGGQRLVVCGRRP